MAVNNDDFAYAVKDRNDGYYFIGYNKWDKHS